MTQKLFNRILLVLSIICLFAILQISFFHIPFNWFKFTDINIEKTNDIIYSLSTSFIAGYIFYLINIQIVSYFREKKSRTLINNYLIDLATQIQVGQLYLKKTYFPNKNFSSLTLSDFSALKTLGNTQINFSYKQTNTLGVVTSCSTGTFSEIDLYFEELNMVKKNIQSIFSFPYISTVNYDLIHILHKIQSSLFYIGVEQINNGVTYLDFEKHFFEHYKNFKELQKFVKPRLTE